MALPGWATTEGTAAYRQRFQGRIPGDHFRLSQGLWLSSIGIGTYLGNHDERADEDYRRAVARSVELGANVVDSAINYRFQRSERAIGAALADLGKAGFERAGVVVATKGGFLPFDGAPPGDIKNYFADTFVKTGVASPADLAAGCHCMTPAYLQNQLDASRQNLGLDCIDIYYVHNPETQLAQVAREEFNERLLKAFEALEGAVAARKIRMYGVATWSAFRVDPNAKEYLSLAEVVEIARQAGGDDHHFKVIQLPLNLGMVEALTKRNQTVQGERLSTLEAAQAFGITVMCSASIYQGQLAKNLPEFVGEVFTGLDSDAQRALQFVRSTPGVTTALVGMKQLRHVEENLRAAEVSPALWEQYARLFKTG
ncbi:MAG TPA: aldo/keto reductase [Verrucomicrobiae bacterium]|jgi:aryl-alcohol dehydrogenase-like predicted oxidoreductase|nr:aldo/keto reductase [Verrucomicrobiae bacterium]